MKDGTSRIDENLRAVRGAYDNRELGFYSAIQALVAGGWSEDRAFKEVNGWPEPPPAIRTGERKMTETLKLKWGTLKAWKLESGQSKAIMERYLASGMAGGAMQQDDTPEQKQIICELIDAIDGEIRNDWSGETLSKDEAKKYVLTYI